MNLLMIFAGFVGAYAAVKIVRWALTLPFKLLWRLIAGKRPRSYRRDRFDDTPMTEYDEFDRWQDNQGL